MVRSPVVAAQWHPLSFVRQAMLSGSFSFLPVRLPDDDGDGWRLVSDVSLARALRSGETRAARLGMPLEEAVASGVVALHRPLVTTPDADVETIAADLSDLPVLVKGRDEGELVGILTAFDLLVAGGSAIPMLSRARGGYPTLRHCCSGEGSSASGESGLL